MTGGRIGFCLLMSKTFRLWKIDQPLLLPASVPDFVGKDLLARARATGIDGVWVV